MQFGIVCVSEYFPVVPVMLLVDWANIMLHPNVLSEKNKQGNVYSSEQCVVKHEDSEDSLLIDGRTFWDVFWTFSEKMD